MKKVFLIIFFFSISFIALAQKIRFSDSTNVWNYSYFSSGIIPPFMWSYTDYYTGDTIIRGIKYKQLWHNSSFETAFIREDTIAQKVFAILPFYGTDTAEKLMYDYTLNIGDTFRIYSDKYYVDSIDSVTINALWYKVWYLKIDSFLYHGSLRITIIEGVGSTYDPCGPISPLSSIIEGGNLLTCFSNRGVTSPISPAFGPYSPDIIGFRSFYFDNSTSCSYDFLKVQDRSYERPSLKLFPNPAADELNIVATTKIHTLTISNLLGVVVYGGDYHSEQVQMSIANFPKGVYFVRINGDKVEKFVKE